MASELLQLLGAHLLDLRLPDLVRHPDRGSFGLVYLHPRSLEDMDLLGASLPEPDISVAPVGRFQGCLTGRSSCEDADLVSFLVAQGEVSGFFLYLSYDNSSLDWSHLSRKNLYCFPLLPFTGVQEGDALVSLTVYDGANGIGGNKIYLEEGGRGVFLDFGKNFGKYGVFYEEFLKNRVPAAFMI